MSGEKKSWGDKVEAEDNRKYKIEILMIEACVLIDYDGVDLTYVCYDLKDI